MWWSVIETVLLCVSYVVVAVVFWRVGYLHGYDAGRTWRRRGE